MKDETEIPDPPEEDAPEEEEDGDEEEEQPRQDASVTLGSVGVGVRIHKPGGVS